MGRVTDEHAASRRPSSGREKIDRDEWMRRFAAKAVDRWAQFPATVEPRPIVLLDSPVRSEGGFLSGDAKMAFIAGAVEGAEGVPEDPLRVLRASRGLARRPHAPLRITAAALTEAAFATDRGQHTMPAWRAEAVDARGPIWVLTEEMLDRCWSPNPVPEDEHLGPHMLVSATVATDDRSLRVTFVGGPESLFRYDAEVLETAAAVTVMPLGRLTRELASGTAITAEGYKREAHVVLKEPLSGRVLVNLDSMPVPVLPA